MIQNTQDTFSNLKNINQKGGKMMIIGIFIFLIIAGIAAYVLVIKPKQDEAAQKSSDDTQSDDSSSSDSSSDGTSKPPEPPIAFKVECTSDTPASYNEMQGEYVKTSTELNDLPKYMNKNNKYYFGSNTSKGVFDVCLADREGSNCSGSKGRSGYIGADGVLPNEGKIGNWAGKVNWSCNVKH